MGIALDPVLLAVGSLGVALVFAASAAGKFRTWSEFPGVVQNYRLLPGRAVRPAARALPVLEALAAVGLLLGPTRPWAAWLALGLLVVFTLAVATNLVRGRRHIDCGCFRFALRQPLSWWLVVRNGLLALMALAAGAGSAEPRALTWLDAVTVGGAAVSLFVLSLAASYVLGPPPVAGPVAAE
jgi:uncharacterized membrane protein YphA (DoxX/SURF4 family)